LFINVSADHRKDDDRLRSVNAEIRVSGSAVVVPSLAHWENRFDGDTNGAEFVIERRSVSGLNGWFSYAWSDSRLHDVVTDERFAADFDQRHTVNTFVAYRWSGRTSLSARARYGSNFPIVGYIGQDADGYLLSSQRNGVRLPEYSRVDVRADRTFTHRKSRLTLFIEVVNVLNRENYRANSPGINITTRRVFDPIEPLFPLLPVAGVLIEF